MPVIQVEGLTKRFGRFTAVDGVSFQVEAGEVFGFLGPNGAGKTTTINVLCTLVRPTAGKAMVAGYDVLRQSGQVRRAIGLVFQDPTVDEQLTAMEHLDIQARCYAIPAREARQRAHHLLRLVELWDWRDKRPKVFSGGMKRRLEMARGLLTKPQVLFLDEPTLGLDPQTRARLWEHLLAIRREEGTTVFMTTHYMDEAEYCDRIAIIDHGRIVALDTPEALKRGAGGDVVTLETPDPEAATAELAARYGIKAEGRDGHLRFEVPNGSEFVPRFLQGFAHPVNSLSVRRPTLDDVFLRLTGRAIRDEQARQEEGWRNMARESGHYG